MRANHPDMDGSGGIATSTGAPRASPAGATFFMFTDIEGSTVRWDRDPESMRDAVRHHDALMRSAIERCGGVVFKTIGDAFCAVFLNGEGAVAATLAATRDLAAADFSAVDGVRVRIALHVGSADERDSDYFGPTLNRVARLLAIGHGGQILLSEAAAASTHALLPPDAELRDLGVHRLKDLTAPEHVFQLTASDLGAEFPPLKSLHVSNNNLPQQVTHFVGRERDVAEIRTIVGGQRIVTLLGTGGVGKTRCALHVGAEMLDEFPDGVWFVDLAPLSDGSLVASEIGTIFNVQESESRPMVETLVKQIAGKGLLLILDNCEHLIDAAATVTAAIVRGCPGVKVLATSREPLNIDGEIVHRLPTLSVPHATKHLTARSALEHGAVALFEIRAQAVSPRFSVTDDNAKVVAEICRRLDGIALAIELAAARLRAMSVHDLAVRLDARFRLLTGGDRTALPRRQTLRALIDWSYDGLSPEDRAVFRALSIFAGSFRAHTAVAVTSSETMDEFAVLDSVASLVEKSMVVLEPSEEESHYRLLESLRAYGREKASENGELYLIALRHARVYADVAECHEREYDTAPTPAWHASVEFDLENVRAALVWSFGDDGDVATGQRLAATLGRIMLSAAAAEARRWVRTGLAHAAPEKTSPAIAARLKLADAALASVLNQFKAAAVGAQEALALFSELDDRRGIADAQRFAGRSMVRMGAVGDGEALLRAALETYAALGTRRIGGTLRDLAVARSLEDDLAGARELFSRALDAFRESEDEENVAVTAAALAEAEFACGDVETALSLAEESLQAIRGFGRDRMAATLLGNIAAYLIVLGCYDLAQAHARAALDLALEVEAQACVAFALQHLAAAAALAPADEPISDERLARIARIAGFVDTRLGALDVVRELTEQREYAATLEILRDRFPADAIMEFMNDGRNWTTELAVQSAAAL